MPTTSAGLSKPRGIWRLAVRGFRASSLALMTRLPDMARVRAPKRATLIQIKVSQPGQPPAAKTIPVKAKG